LPPARSGTSREDAEYQGKCRGVIFSYRYVSVLRESASRIHFWLLDIRTSLAHRARLGNAVKRSWSHSPCSCARYTVENSNCVSDTRILRVHTFEAGAAVCIHRESVRRVFHYLSNTTFSSHRNIPLKNGLVEVTS